MQALRDCVKNGLDVWIATARSYRTVFGKTGPLFGLDFLEEKGVFYNGAYAVNKVNGYSKHYPIQSSTVTDLLDLVESVEPDIQIAIQNKEDHSFRFYDDETLEFWACKRQECIDYSEARTRPSSKIVIWDDAKDLTNLYKILQVKYGDSLNIFLTDSNCWIMVMSKVATKENALLDMLSYHDVSPEQVVVFGDGLNDIGMIRIFGCGVAVANARQELKNVASFITLSNDEHGVSYALREILGLI